MRNLIATMIVVLSCATAWGAEFVSGVMASNVTGRVADPTNFFDGNLFAGTNVTTTPTNAGGKYFHAGVAAFTSYTSTANLGPSTNTGAMNQLGGNTNWGAVLNKSTVENQLTTTNSGAVNTLGGQTNWGALQVNGALVTLSTQTNAGAINNAGPITNWNTEVNLGASINTGTISNAAGINNASGVTNWAGVVNKSTLENQLTVTNAGAVNTLGGNTNWGAVVHKGTVENRSTSTNAGAAQFAGPVTNWSNVYLPTNAASISTAVPAALHSITMNTPWTNDLGARAELLLSVQYIAATTGVPQFYYSNTVSGVCFTQMWNIGLAATQQMVMVVPDVSPGDYGVLTNLTSGTGASVTILNAWWKLK